MKSQFMTCSCRHNVFLIINRHVKVFEESKVFDADKRTRQLNLQKKSSHSMKILHGTIIQAWLVYLDVMVKTICFIVLFQ